MCAVYYEARQISRKTGYHGYLQFTAFVSTPG